MMKIMSKIGSLFVVLVLGVIVIAFAYNLRQQTQVTEGQSGYPAPNNLDVQSDPYPPPQNTQTITLPEDTTEHQWITYAGEEIGFTFQHRSDFLISTTSNPANPFGSVRIIFPRTGAMNIQVLENPGYLTIEEFLKSNNYDTMADSSVWTDEMVQTHGSPLTIANQSAISFESHRDLIPQLGAAGYVVFVPFDGFVVEATLDGGGPAPDNGPQPYNASQEAIDLAIQVLNTLQIP